MLDESSERNVAPLGGRRQSNFSNFEKNCSQIFVKAPTLTREFFEKVNNDVVPRKTNLYGYQFNTRTFIVISGLMLLFIFSTIGTITMWFTNSFQKRVESEMVISESGVNYEMWRKPPVKPYVKFYIFNYTNVEDFELGKAKKLHVEEVGPYVYFEELERVNVRFSKADGTVSYQEKRSYRFSPELSKGHPDDLVMVPNIPLLTGATLVKKLNFFLRIGYNGLLKALSEKPFILLKASSIIGGYDNHLIDLGKNYMKLEDKRVFDSFGILVAKQGIQPDIITINTGAHNINDLGQMETFNGQNQYELWGSDSCNQIKSSSGIMFPMEQVKAKKSLAVFVPQMCRKLPLHFVKETTMLDRVPVYRYNLSTDVFDSAGNPDNQCYCDISQGNCPPQGLFNASACLYDVPIFYSWPHMYGVDPVIKDSITGLNKSPIINDTYIDIHPKLGITMGVRFKIQVNVQLERSFGLSELNKYPDGLMLPVTWIDSGLEEKDLTDDMISMIYQATFTVRNVELGLKYGCLLASIMTLTCILLVLKRQNSRSRVDSMSRPISV